MALFGEDPIRLKVRELEWELGKLREKDDQLKGMYARLAKRVLHLESDLEEVEELEEEEDNPYEASTEVLRR